MKEEKALRKHKENDMSRGANGTDNFCPTDRPNVCEANTEGTNRYLRLSTSDTEKKKYGIRYMTNDARPHPL